MGDKEDTEDKRIKKYFKSMNSILTGQEIVRLNGDALARKKGLHCDIQELGSHWFGDERAPGK